jgi:hypothetical protein
VQPQAPKAAWAVNPRRFTALAGLKVGKARKRILKTGKQTNRKTCMANQSQNDYPKRMPMVGWFNPRQLAQTAVEVGVSTIFGRHSDHRLVEAMAAGEKGRDFYDYSCQYKDDGQEVCEPDQSKARDSIWIDYVGDVGDGWNSTYAIAYYLAGPRSFKYTVGETTYDTTETQRGDILIFGGDEVYPTASRDEYDRRLVAPYTTALRNSNPPYPHVFAIPGNHDWYDSLVAFTRLFTARPWFAGWRTRQKRSYFALKLPHNWWLLGTDVQLGSDIDKPQMEYFERLAAEMDKQAEETGEPATIILCHAEPHWIRAAQYGGDDPNYNESNLKLLEKRLGKAVAVYIAGDLHHYRRHESEDKSTQKITAGGGGAFLHPTHVGLLGKNLDELVEKGLTEGEERKFHLRSCFPSTKESRRVCWRNLQFPFFLFQGNQSGSFGFVIAALYLLLTLSLVFAIDDLALRHNHQFGYVTYTTVETLIHNPLSMFLIVATVLGFIFFANSHSTWYRILMGGLHGALHALAAVLIALLTVFALTAFTAPETWTLHIPWPGGFQFSVDVRLLLAAVIIFVVAFFVGQFIMGAYLLFSFNFFGRHGNEAFSSIGVEDWKNFLRIQIDTNGNLAIYPIGIRRVPRKWKPAGPGAGPELVPDDPKATEPVLIEKEPIFMMKNRDSDTGVKKEKWPG